MPRLLLSLTMLAAAVWLLLRRQPRGIYVTPDDVLDYVLAMPPYE